MIHIIEVGSDAFNELISKVIQTTVKTCRLEMKQEEDFITQEQAMELMKVKSKQKMKNIRESGVIKFKSTGRAFLYSKKSLLDWMNK